MNAKAWLERERDLIEKSAATGEPWKPPAERATEKKAKVLRFSEYGETVIAQRILKPRTRIEYEAKWSQLIEPKLGKLAVRDLTTAAVRAWFTVLDSTKPVRNAHAYAVLNMICNTALKDGLLDRNPCQITGAMNTRAKANFKPITIAELHTIADKLGADENHGRFKALVLLAGWCGLRYGEVAELRRKDLDRDCTVVSVTRAVGHRSGECLLGRTKTGEARNVDIPPQIQRDIKDHLAQYVSSDPESLLFVPARGGCHLNDRVFNKDVFQKAAKDVGRSDLSAHDLRRFAGTTNALVGATMAENMRRLGHRTFKAAMFYQHARDNSRKKLAADLSAHALVQLQSVGENSVK